MLWTRDDRSTVGPSTTLHESCATGDADAIAEFYRLYQPELVAYARRQYADDPEGVADLAVFDTVSRLATMRTLEVRAVRAYLYRALKGRLADERARAGVDQHPTASPPVVVAAESDPEAIVLGQLGLHELLDLLTDAEREVVTHRFVGGYSSRETARRVGRSPDAVRRLQSNAMARLRFALAALVAVALLLGGAYWLVTRSPFVVDTSPVERPAEGGPPTSDRPTGDLAPTVPDRPDTGGAGTLAPGLPESATSSVPGTSATAGQETTTTAPAQPTTAPSSTNPSQRTSIASGEAPTSQPSATNPAATVAPQPTTTAPGSTTTAAPGSTTTAAPSSTTTTTDGPARGADGNDGNDGNP